MVDCKCFFRSNTNISQDTVRDTFEQETQVNGTSQWLGETFQVNGLMVRGTSALCRVKKAWPFDLPSIPFLKESGKN